MNFKSALEVIGGVGGDYQSMIYNNENLKS